jgi:CheY-like chemotaxis protein
VVDDEPDATRLVKLVLQDCGATVTEATSAQRAFDFLSQSHFDVLVSDIGMPDEDGYRLIRKVRAMPNANKDIPAIALTAFARSEDRRRAALAGFQTHLAKPIEAPELIANVANLSGRAMTEKDKISE